MSTNVWEKHAGCRQKNWKKSIKLKGTEKPLFKFLEEIPEEAGISSIASEIQQVSSVDTSDQPAAETSDQPAAETSYQQAAETSELAAVTSDQPSASLSYAMSGNKSQKSKVCILHDYDRMKSHQDKDTDHEYEKASRISEIMNTLNQDGVLDRTEREPFDSADREIILAVHDPEQLDYVDGLPMTDEEQEAKFSKVAGVSVFSSKGTTEAIYGAAGAVIRGSDLVVEEYYETAFAIIRPPGHHAHKISEGFCFLNNVAIATQHVVDHHHIERALLVDFDVHHGNGTQKLFYGSKQVLFFNTHRMDLPYPASKNSVNNIGEGVGLGYNINVPLKKGFNDVDMLYVCDQLLVPVATEFKPEVVFVSAGYDAGEGETIGGCNVAAKGFGTIVRKLLPLSGGKMVLALEGGYNLVHLPICVSHTIRAILGDEDAFLQDSDYRDKRPFKSTIRTVNTVKHNLRLCWDVFKEKPSGPSPEAEAPLLPGGLGGGPGGAGSGAPVTS
ncbi:histone deacetylase 5-like isoform X2 [Triticum dicoccoides]|uniref:histone deacetylase 5-like isoform X2 n=1 Tax=Triticum dicoccoides TaxID=85692 RepID=UPI001890AB0F|nr:histone deacetylase 5-like isoform X2 [Triticum dicoccoides]